MSRIFFFGYGYTASHLAQRLREEGWEMAGTTRSDAKVKQMWEDGVQPHIWDGTGKIEAPGKVVGDATHILHSVPPSGKGDPVLLHHHKLLKAYAPRLKWLGYISTISVYGDTHGEAAREDYEPNPGLRAGKARLMIENGLLRMHRNKQLPVHIFRAGAIYGTNRSAIRRVLQFEPEIVHADGKVLSRIHVEDLANIIYASMMNPNPGSIYNCVDDLPSPPEAPLELAYDLVGKERPPVKDYEDVKDELNPGVRNYYLENRLISNQKVKDELGIELKYPTYHEGYAALNEARIERRDRAIAEARIQAKAEADAMAATSTSGSGTDH